MAETLYPLKPIFMIDDEENFLKSASFILKSNGINNIMLSSDSEAALTLLYKNEYSLILLDLNMPKIAGVDILKKIVVDFPQIPVVILTAEMRIEKAVECIKEGAYDYIVKPVDKNKLLTMIRNIINLNEIRDENELLKRQIVMKKSDELFNSFYEIITNNDEMKSIFKYADAIARTNLPVLITGETGTGKELLAKAIHRISGREGKFVPINISGIDDTMISDTLFGHKRGSFTGSVEPRKGLLEQASNGTLFLDEIGDLDLNSQIKLLRVLQERMFYPIGSDVEVIVDVRFIFATNQEIEKLIIANKIRKDFYYRLQSHHIHLPPLRDRKDDIPLLIEYFFEKASKDLNKKKPSYPKELITILNNYNFPGNIRELGGMINDALSMHNKGIISLKSFYEKINLSGVKTGEYIHNGKNIQNIEINTGLPDKFLTLKEIEKYWIKKALEKADGNQTIAAKLLGISRRALNNRLNRDKQFKDQ